MDPAVRRRRVFAILAGFAALPVIAALVYFVVPATSFSPAALGYSVTRETDGDLLSSKPCKERTSGDWTCEVWNLGRSGHVIYRVDMEGSRCWHGRRMTPGWDEDGNLLPREVSGCLKIRDQFRLGKRLLDDL